MSAPRTDGPILDLGGAVALVTGAGQGVGRRVAIDLAAHGAGAVVVNDIDAARADAVAAEIRATGTTALPAPFDVTDFGAVGEMFAHVQAVVGAVGVLVNNAGNQGAGDRPPPSTPFWEQEPSDWAPAIDVNLNGVLNCTRHAIGQMVGEGYGRVVTVISDAGRVGEIGGLEIYSGAKAGAAGFTRAMARLGGRYGITANCISLGAIRTPATADLLSDPTVEKRALSAYTVRRIGEPEDPAAVVTLLASRATSWITGQTIPVNGGYSVAL